MAVSEDDVNAVADLGQQQLGLHEISTAHFSNSKGSLAESNNNLAAIPDEDDDEDDDNQHEAYLYGLLGMGRTSSSKSLLSCGIGSDSGSLGRGEEKSWKTMDSVHSRCSTLNSKLNSSDDSFNYNDSCASFASFNDSGSDMNDSMNELKDAFTKMNDNEPVVSSLPPPRRVPLTKSSSMRFNRAASFRGTLSLIEEKEG
jgi:hypothetical protein